MLMRGSYVMSAELCCTPINGVYELLTKPAFDSRGFFLNAFRAQEETFMSTWGHRGIAQVNLSRNNTVGTIRGLHFQSSPHSEAKMVRCIDGSVWDVVVDLRRDSVTYGRWHAVELTPQRGNALLIPEGCAHGFQVLQPCSELLYLHSGSWVPEAEKGVRWDDPKLSITWPLPPNELSDRDRSLPYLNETTSFF